MRTSFFGNMRSLAAAADGRLVAISRGVPKWFQGPTYTPLAPSWALIKVKDEALYTRGYESEVLRKLDPQKVYEQLGEDAILLCWEKPGEFCHRRLVAGWLETNLGILVPEWRFEPSAKAPEPEPEVKTKKKRTEPEQLTILSV